MRLLIKVPVAFIESLSESELTVNQQIAQIIEDFYWDSLPFKFEIDCRNYEFRQLTVQVSLKAKKALDKYWMNNGKSKAVVLVQALIALGRYQLPS
jgi:hypothetical protein